MDEPGERLSLAGVEQDAQVVDVVPDVVGVRPPVADPGGAMDDDVDLCEGPTESGTVGRIAADDSDALRFESLRVAIGPGENGDVSVATTTCLDDMAADESGGAGDQKSHRDPSTIGH